MIYVDTGLTGLYSATQWRCQNSTSFGWPSHSIVFQVALTGRLELISREIVSCDREQRLSRWAHFAKDCLTQIGVQRVTAILQKISHSWAPKNGVQHATVIYPIPQYTRPRYIGSTLYTAGYYLQITHEKDTHSLPVRTTYGCLSWVPSLTEVLSTNLLCCVQYGVILYRDLSRVYSIRKLIQATGPPYLSSHPGYLREPHWLLLGLPDISRVTQQVWSTSMVYLPAWRKTWAWHILGWCFWHDS